jgi:hypothetical protein
MASPSSSSLKPEILLQCSHKTTNGLYLGPVESSLYPHTEFLKSILILSPHVFLGVTNSLLASGFPADFSCVFLSHSSKMLALYHPQSQSQSQSYFTTGGLTPISPSWPQAPWDPRPVFCGYSPYVTSSLTREWVCSLQLLLVLASAVILRSEPRGTHDHILLSQTRDSPNLEGHVFVSISPRNRVAQLYPQTLGSPFIASSFVWWS